MIQGDFATLAGYEKLPYIGDTIPFVGDGFFGKFRVILYALRKKPYARVDDGCATIYVARLTKNGLEERPVNIVVDLKHEGGWIVTSVSYI